MLRRLVLISMITFLCAGFLLSCAKKSIATEKAALNSRMTEYTTFVVTNSNDTIKGTKWNIKHKKGSWYILIDGKQYIDTSVMGFQSQYGVATRFQSAEKAHSFIDQWAYFLRRGKVNVFSNDRYMGRFSYYNSATKTREMKDSYRLFFYYKINDLFYDMNVSNLRSLIQGHPAALAAFNESNIKDNDKDFIIKLLKIIDVYNG